jgi:small ligand-binding sensory domain FIST
MTIALPFRAAHAAHADWNEAAAQIAHDLGDVGKEHTLGFLYVSDAYANSLNEIAEFLRLMTGVSHWVGTVGMGVCGTEREYFDTAAMSVLVTPFADSSFRIFHDLQSETLGDIGPLQDWLDPMSPPLAIVHGDPSNAEMPQLIKLMSDKTGGFLVGGLSSSRGGYAQLADKIVEGGLSGVMLSPAEIPVVTGLTQGCSPIGPTHEVSEAEQNVLLSLDGKPALDVFREDIGEELAEDLQRCAGLIFAAIPVEGSDTGDYLVRNLIGIDPQSGAIKIGEYVEASQRVMFCRRDQVSAEGDLRRMTRNLKQRAGGEIKGGLYYSCVARGPNQFGLGSRELGIIAEELGAFPLAGFFANGEISHNRLYGYTGVLTLFL